MSTATHTYRTIDVPVPGGALRIGVWDPVEPATADLLAIHGVTASHRAWPFVVAKLPGVRIIAPDLRGRGRSNSIEGPAGMASHAHDLAAVLDALDVRRTVVAGHSMGAFVAIVFARLHPDRVSRLVLVDGGLPLDVPEGLDADELVSRILGPTAARLSMRFADVAEYLAFWREHPAFRNDWSPELEAYLEYDLVPDGPSLRPATSYAITAEDTADMNTGTVLPAALAGLTHPTLLLTAPRGLLDEEPGLYAPARLPGLLAEHPDVRHERVEGRNHYTIVMSETGADAVAAAIARELALAGAGASAG